MAKKTSKKVKKDFDKFGKKLMTKFIDTECNRQMFLTLAKENTLWVNKIRKLESVDRPISGSSHIKLDGQKYEQKVYRRLIPLPGAIFQPKAAGKNPSVAIGPFSINPARFKSHNTSILSGKSPHIILLEHQFPTSEMFIKEIFKPKHINDPIAVEYSKQRPDIMIIQQITPQVAHQNKTIHELLPNGKLRKVPSNEWAKRMAIRVIDIKNTASLDVGKQQFIEIVYYMRALSHYLIEMNLDGDFFVCTDQNGIFPRYEQAELNQVNNLQDFLKMIIPINIYDVNRVFSNSLKKITEIWDQSPCVIEDVTLNIQPSCGYCRYLDDCVKTLGKDKKMPTNPANWDLRLMPYTSRSIVQQLEDRGFKTIGDVYTKINTITPGPTPSPLNAELPLLKLKAQALVKQQIVYPETGQIHSYSIPRNTQIALTIVTESDPSTERVFAIGMNLSMIVFNGNKIFQKFEQWWQLVKQALQLKSTHSRVGTITAYK